MQTAFGFEYMKNFLGADLVFITSEIPENVVVATPLNNIMAYYVDPGDSELLRQVCLIRRIRLPVLSDSTHRGITKERFQILLP